PRPRLAHREWGDAQHLGRELTLGRLEPPHAGLFVPLGTLDLTAEVQMGANAVPVGQVAQVVAYLGLEGIGPRPVRVRRERVAVQVRRDVALAAGIGAAPPGAADL